MKRCSFLLVLMVATAAARGDVVYLADGSVLTGDVKRGPGGYVITQPDGRVQNVPLDQVKSIELAAPATTALTPGAAREKLASLRRSVEYLDDAGKVVERYQRFIEQNANTALEAEARRDLAMWQARRDQGLVKFAGKWITPAERAAMQETALRQADAARRALSAGRVSEAQSLIDQSLAADPNNAAAIYLRGLLQYRQDQLIPARKSFEVVNVLVPNHGPTLNNLAVVLARQNQHATALATYDQAMLAAPKTKEILNNVAELLYAVPDEARATPVAQRALRRFTEQDEDLARELEKQGLHRWGATWVTTQQREELKQAEREAKDKLDQLAAEFDGVKVRISNIDREIEDNERAMRRLEATSYVRDINGQIWQAALPPLYGELQEDNRRLQRERQDQYARLDRLREQARAVNRSLPVPKYTGIQRMMDATFAPVVAPVAAPTTTSPTTAPAPSTAPAQERTRGG
jgi:tetratricopeptide (TPR) repeat protein